MKDYSDAPLSHHIRLDAPGEPCELICNPLKVLIERSCALHDEAHRGGGNVHLRARITFQGDGSHPPKEEAEKSCAYKRPQDHRSSPNTAMH